MVDKKTIKNTLREYIKENCGNVNNYKNIDEFLDNIFKDPTIEYENNSIKFYVNGELLMVKYPNRAVLDYKLKNMIETLFFFDSEYDLRCIIKKWIMKNYQVKSKGQHFGVRFNDSWVEIT
jgi:hypothetical protein